MNDCNLLQFTRNADCDSYYPKICPGERPLCVLVEGPNYLLMQVLGLHFFFPFFPLSKSVSLVVAKIVQSRCTKCLSCSANDFTNPLFRRLHGLVHIQLWFEAPFLLSDLKIAMLRVTTVGKYQLQHLLFKEVIHLTFGRLLIWLVKTNRCRSINPSYATKQTSVLSAARRCSVFPVGKLNRCLLFKSAHWSFPLYSAKTDLTLELTC